MLAITILNLTETFFVSRLGTAAFAAMGAGSVLARAMGRQEHQLRTRRCRS